MLKGDDQGCLKSGVKSVSLKLKPTGKIVQMARRFSHRVILLLCFVVVPKDFPLSWVRFKLDKEWERDQVFKQMGGLWGASKSRLVSDVKNAANEEERLQLQPDNIKSVHDWKDFVKEKTSQEFKVQNPATTEL